MKKWWPLLVVIISSRAFAQSYNDEGLLYTQSGTFGTARTIGAGGAFGSVGADLGSLATNPAGIGLYRSFDFSVTPMLDIKKNEAQFNGSFKNQSATRPAITQGGIVLPNCLSEIIVSLALTQISLTLYPLPLITKGATAFRVRKVFLATIITTRLSMLT